MEKRKFSSTFWEGVFLLFVSVFGVVMSLISHKDFNVEWKLSPYLFPLIISFFLLFLSISIILDGLKNKDEKKEKILKIIENDHILHLFYLSLKYILLHQMYLDKSK